MAITEESTDTKNDNNGIMWTVYVNNFNNLDEMDKFLENGA